MKRSCLSETYLSLNGSINNTSLSYLNLFWEITSANMEDPIMPSITLKRTIYET